MKSAGEFARVVGRAIALGWLPSMNLFAFACIGLGAERYVTGKSSAR